MKSYFFLFQFLILCALPLKAQDALSLEEIQKKISQLEKEESSAENNALLTQWNTALTLKSQLKDIQQQQQNLSAKLKQIPQKLQKVRQPLPAPDEDSIKNIKQIDFTTLRALLDTKSSDLQAVLIQEANITAEYEQQSARINELPDRIRTAKTERDKLPIGEKIVTSEGGRAAALILQLNKLLKQHEIELLEMQLNYDQSAGEFSEAEKKIINQKKTALEKDISQLRTEIEIRNNAVALSLKEQIANQLKVFSQSSTGIKIIKQNETLSLLNQRLENEISSILSQQEQMIREANEITEQRIQIQNSIQLFQSSGLKIDAKMAELFRVQESKLPSVSELTSALQKRLDQANDKEILDFSINYKLNRSHIQPAEQLNAIIKELKGTEIKEEEIQKVLTTHQELIRKVNKNYTEFIMALRNLNDVTNQTIQQIHVFHQLLDDHLMWVPNTYFIGTKDFVALGQTLQEILLKEPKKWGSGLIKQFKNSTLWWILGFLGLCMMQWKRPWLWMKLRQHGVAAESVSCDRISETFYATFFTLFLSLPIPLWIAWLGWQSNFSKPIQQGVMDAVYLLMLTSFLKTCCTQKGIFISHFAWSAHRAELLLKHLRWMQWVAPILIVLMGLVASYSNQADASRPIFIVLMLAISWFLYAVLKPKQGLLEYVKLPKIIVEALFLILVCAPLFFALASALGYHNFPDLLKTKIQQTLWLVVLGLYYMRFLKRWILMRKRNIAVQQASKNHEMNLAIQSAGGSLDDVEQNHHDKHEDTLTITTVEQQTQKLLSLITKVGLFFGLISIWSGLLPALSFLDRIPLWQNGPKIEQTVETKNALPAALTSSGTTATSVSPHKETPKNPMPASASSFISLQDLLISLFIITITVMAAKNIPGLLELGVLRRLDLEPGASYAISSISRYLIIGIGFIFALGLIGLEWSKLQWLAAAISLGIGFGLQEIFANFVAGIILLFERPIRIGDIITINSISGKVSRIQIRATTIRQFDNRELIVPNKQFITGSLVNWTLSDTVLRFEVPVSIVYEEDSKKATQILQEIVNLCPNIMKDPEPQIVFLSFGTSSLNFVIRAFVSKTELIGGVQDHLHHEIHARFRKEGLHMIQSQHDSSTRPVEQEAKTV